MIRSTRAFAAGLVLCCVVLAATGCSKTGGGQVATSIRRGESGQAVLEVKAGEAEGGTLESCDLVLVDEQETNTAAALGELDVVLGKPGKTAERKCGVVATLTAHADAAPGDYSVEVTFFYKWSAVFQGTQEGDDFGTIHVTITR
jgi:hypothetical protein